MKSEFFAYSNKAEENISDELGKFYNKNALPVVVCLGTDKVLADALGPITGSLLQKENLPTYVYGSLQRPITLNNLDYCLNYVKALHPHLPVWVVDASTARTNRFGIVTITDKFNAFNTSGESKELNADLFITATVSVAEKRVLMGARLRVVNQVSEVVAKSILRCFAC